MEWYLLQKSPERYSGSHIQQPECALEVSTHVFQQMDKGYFLKKSCYKNRSRSTETSVDQAHPLTIHNKNALICFPDSALLLQTRMPIASPFSIP